MLTKPLGSFQLDYTQSQIIIVLIALLPEALFQAALYPLAPYVVRHVLGVPSSAVDDRIGYYTGLVNTCYFFPLFAMNVLWGHLSDILGRKTILLLGLIAGGISALMIGLSSSIETVLLARVLGGIFGANLSIGKSSIGDLTMNNDDSRSWGFTMFGCLYGFAGIFGPLVGGILSFSDMKGSDRDELNMILRTYPFIIPCVGIFLLSISSIFCTLAFLKEPSKSKPTYSRAACTSVESDIIVEEELDTDEHDNDNIPPCDSPSRDTPTPTYLSTFKAALWPIILYCFIAYMSMHYSTSVPLYLSTPEASFGLEMGTRQTSLAMTIFSTSKLASQIFLSTWLLRIAGNAVRLYAAVMSLLVPVLLIFPMTAFFGNIGRIIFACVLTWLIGLTDAMSFLAVNILVTDSGTSQNLGIVHGLATTLSALMRAISSTTAGALWQLSVSFHAPIIVFLIGATISFVAALLARRVDRKSFKRP